ncbi:hypothetical protein LTR56_002336 [Elasticomyces elasticus]|nr:hypothetical protein LTR56_002336 [Elasticomyces elasticus]KAK3665900.1 hypothetical protein LTR22_003219 [Elasticomyces elasticus]KAK4929372.1 hypothetical protein LTR49_003976 [Elasticomyces elasticus]KAK5764661.1 hypothetical protein LTS12_005162 [Elasticomyces elasticus]
MDHDPSAEPFVSNSSRHTARIIDRHPGLELQRMQPPASEAETTQSREHLVPIHDDADSSTYRNEIVTPSVPWSDVEVAQGSATPIGYGLHESELIQPLLMHNDARPDDAQRAQFLSLDYVSHWFPKTDPENPKAKPQRRTDRDNALLIQLTLAITTLSLNLIATIYATQRYGQKGGIGELYKGHCKTAEWLNAGLHLIINMLSTLLLVASNYCAHVLSAPTRREVDIAHGQHVWLDIGVPSVRNLSHISWKRVTAWLLLLSSSGLLHLTYNSAVFLVSPKNSYRVAFVTSDFGMDSASWTEPQVLGLQRSLLAGDLTELSNDDCLNLYLNNTIALYDVVVVARNVTMRDGRSRTANPSSSLLDENWNMYGSKDWVHGFVWPCLAACAPGPACFLYGLPWCQARLIDSEEWTVAAWTYDPSNGPMGAFSIGLSDDPSQSLRMGVDRCYSAGHDDSTHCTVRYSFGVMVMVCGLNFVKVACIVYTLVLFRIGARDSDQTSLECPEGDHSLVTVGDAVASFLKRPDEHTKYLPLVTKHDFVKGQWPSSGNGNGEAAKRYRRLSQIQHWYKAPTLRRWLLLLARLVGSADVFPRSLTDVFPRSLIYIVAVQALLRL